MHACVLLAVCFLVSAQLGVSAARFSSADCEWKEYEQPLSHFARGSVYDKFWKPNEDLPVFFYTGNESPVGEYVNNTGLMWEYGKEINALLIFT